MSYAIYKLIHLGGLMLVFLGLGSKSLRNPGGEDPPRSSGMVHGIGMFLMLLGGFGMLARLQGAGTVEGYPLWMILKVVVWLVLGAMPVLMRKGLVPFAWGVSTIVGVVGAYLALYKPFV